MVLFENCKDIAIELVPF